MLPRLYHDVKKESGAPHLPDVCEKRLFSDPHNGPCLEGAEASEARQSGASKEPAVGDRNHLYIYYDVIKNLLRFYYDFIRF